MAKFKSGDANLIVIFCVILVIGAVLDYLFSEFLGPDFSLFNLLKKLLR